MDLVLLLLLGVTLVAPSSAVPRLRHRMYKTCIRNRSRPGWFESLPKEQARICWDFYQRMPRNNRVAEQHSVSEDPDTPRNLALQYMKGLGNWKNAQSKLGPHLLDHVSPCWSKSKEVEDEWTALYEKRRDSTVAVMKMLEQDWEQDRGFAVVGPVRNSYRGGRLEAAELLLQRQSPSEIGEVFGRYRTAVHLTNDNHTKRVHSDYQASCSSPSGNLMVLDLDLSSIAAWQEENEGNLNLKVIVQPRRQYFQPGSNLRGSKVNVVKQIVALVLHFNSTSEKISPRLMSARNATRANGISPAGVSDSNSEGSSIMRQLMGSVRIAGASRTRRSARQSPFGKQTPNHRTPPSRVRPAECHLASFKLSRRMYDHLNIVHPDHGDETLDIGECVGDCPFSLSSLSLRATNHAVAIWSEMPYESMLTICCVPNEYKHVYFTDDSDPTLLLSQTKYDNFIAISCACR